MQTIRAASAHDLPGAYRVCLKTGDSGGDATALFRNPDLLGHIYVGPYIMGEPDLAFVVADDEGVAGYCLGALDTRRFETWQQSQWWPLLREQHAVQGGDTDDARAIQLIHEPPMAPAEVVGAYPSHLHVDLLERARGRGVGRLIIERLLEQMTAGGSAGVHLEVGASNTNAIGFYRHLGFVDLQATEDSLFMGRRLVPDE